MRRLGLAGDFCFEPAISPVLACQSSGLLLPSLGDPQIKKNTAHSGHTRHTIDCLAMVTMPDKTTQLTAIEQLESAIDEVHSIVAESHRIQWQGFLRYAVSQLSHANVVAADLWVQTNPTEDQAELSRPPGGLFIDPSFIPPNKAMLERLKRQPPPTSLGVGIAGNHWGIGHAANEGSLRGGSLWVDQNLDTSKHGGSPARASLDTSKHGSGHGGTVWTSQADGSLHPPSHPRVSHASKVARSATAYLPSVGLHHAKGHHEKGHHEEGHNEKGHLENGHQHHASAPSKDRRARVAEWNRLEFVVNNPEVLMDDYGNDAANIFSYVAMQEPNLTSELPDVLLYPWSNKSLSLFSKEPILHPTGLLPQIPD